MRRSRRTADLTPSASTSGRRDPAPQRMDLRHRLGIADEGLLRALRMMESQLASPTRSRTTRSVSRSFASASGALFSSTAGSRGSRALSRIAHRPRPAADSRDVMVGSGDRIRYRLRVGLHFARSFAERTEYRRVKIVRAQPRACGWGAQKPYPIYGACARYYG